jgi:Cd2+/Zn2+-exporting ATPase
MTKFHIADMRCAKEADYLKAKLTGLGSLKIDLPTRTIALSHNLPNLEPVWAVFKAAGFEATEVTGDGPMAKPQISMAKPAANPQPNPPTKLTGQVSRFHIADMCCAKEADYLKAKLTGLGSLEIDPPTRTIALSHNLPNLEPVWAVFKAAGFEATEVTGDGPMAKPQISMAKPAANPQPNPPSKLTGPVSRFHISDMCCAMEVNQLQSKLEKVAGVNQLDFNLNSRTVAIQHDLPSLEPLWAVIKAAGFEAKELKEAEVPEETVTPWKRYIIATLLAFTAEGLHWREAPYYLPVVVSVLSFICCGFAVYKQGLVSFKNLKLDMNALMSLAVTGAVLIGEVAEGAMVLALFSLAEGLEDRSLSKARATIASLLGLTPDKATVRGESGQFMEIKAEEVPIGSIIQIRPGEKLPLDGRVLSGFTTINQAPVTGESAPVDKNPGDQVFAGTINGQGSIVYETTAVFADSTLAKVASFVEATESQKAPVQRIVDKFAAYYTPAVFGLAFLVAIIPPLFLLEPWGPWLYKALVLLVISCPCALVISVPVTILSGLAAAAKKGLIIKGGAVLEEGRKIKVVALDKTGTITTGKPRKTDFRPLFGADSAKTFKLAASLAARSDHPVSRAIYDSYEDKDNLLEVDNLLAYPGKGLGGQIANQEYLLGGLRLLSEKSAPDPQVKAVWDELTGNGQTGVILLEDGKPLAVFAVADALRDDSLAAIKEMKSLGLKTVMLTGDNEAVAQAVARDAGVDGFYGELLPEDKAKVIEKLKSSAKVAMVGDGINDAPALVTADIGMAMAMMGTDVAIETASVAIMDDKLSKIPAFIRLAKSVWSIVVQNFILVFAVKLFFLILTMLGVTYMWMAVIADIGVCLLVVGNGLRAIRK